GGLVIAYFSLTPCVQDLCRRDNVSSTGCTSPVTHCLVESATKNAILALSTNDTEWGCICVELRIRQGDSHMILIVIGLIGFAAGWRWSGRRLVLFLPALILGVIQVAHLTLSAITNTLGDSTLLPIVMGVFWLGATWVGAAVSTKRVTW